MKKYLLSLITGLFIFSSCADKLDLAPENAITQEQIMALLASGDQAKIDLVIGGLASNLPNWWHRNLGGSDPRNYSPLGLWHVNSIMGNNLVNGDGTNAGSFGSNVYLQYIGKVFMTSTLNMNTNRWMLGWDCIAEANRMLDLLTDEVVGDNTKMKAYKAQAYSMRAYAYNYLMENYRSSYTSGDGLMIYDKLGGDYKPCSSASETYAFIKSDLESAIKLFAESKIGEDEDGYTDDITDIDMGFANYTMARASLLSGDYQRAIQAADALLAKYPDLIPASHYGGQNTGESIQDPVFLAKDNAFVEFTNNPEVIFGFKGVSDGRNTVSVWLNVFGYSYGGGSDYDYARINNLLYDKINDKDVRKKAFLGNVAIESFMYNSATPHAHQIPTYSNLKFAATHGPGGTQAAGDIAVFDICYMRVSEVLLIKAEAQALSNNESGAKATLDKLLAARSVEGATLTADTYGNAGSVLDQVKLQWDIEMWGENGSEFFNNKRWGRPVQRSTTDGSIHWSSMTISIENMTLDFPANETMYNPNL